MIYFTSDLHLGPKSIIKSRTKFKTIEEHDEAILNEFRKLKKKEIVYILGDFIFDCERYDYYVEEFKKMQCRIKLVLGNHDSLKLYNEPRFEIQLPLFCYKDFWISHCPVHDLELRGRKGNIHGHLHGYNIPDEKYFNVNIENHDFRLVRFKDIKKHIAINTDGYYEEY